MSYPLKKVLRFELLTTRYNRPGEGSYKFTLECGHTVWAKQSSGEPRRKRCRDCGQFIQRTADAAFRKFVA